jgi:hypothetical protein
MKMETLQPTGNRSSALHPEEDGTRKTAYVAAPGAVSMVQLLKR